MLNFCQWGLHQYSFPAKKIEGSQSYSAKVLQGDGSSSVSCQWTYTAHKKPVFAVTYLEASGLVASCDAAIHLWDPYMTGEVAFHFLNKAVVGKHCTTCFFVPKSFVKMRKSTQAFSRLFSRSYKIVVSKELVEKKYTISST